MVNILWKIIFVGSSGKEREKIKRSFLKLQIADS